MDQQSRKSIAAAASTRSISTSTGIRSKTQRLSQQSLRESPGYQNTSLSRSLTRGCRMAGALRFVPHAPGTPLQRGACETSSTSHAERFKGQATLCWRWQIVVQCSCFVIGI